MTKAYLVGSKLEFEEYMRALEKGSVTQRMFLLYEGFLEDELSKKREKEYSRLLNLADASEDMYAALQNILNGIETGVITSDHEKTFASAIKQAREAIKRAEGK